MKPLSDLDRAQHCYQKVLRTATNTSSAKNKLQGLADHLDDIKPNMLFAASPGRHYDPRLHYEEAISRGAKAIICEGSDGWKAPHLNFPIYVEPNLPPIVGYLAHWLNASPSENMRVLAVTGTNAKTSIVWALSQALNVLQHRCGIIGTLGWGVASNLLPTSLTTPSAANTQRYLASLRYKTHCDYAAIEASSIALDQHRLTGCHFYCNLFTHLTHDHLDYHKNVEQYFKSKMKLFCDYPSQHALINMNDDYGQRLWQHRQQFSAKHTWGVIHQSKCEAFFAKEVFSKTKDSVFIVEGDSAKHFTLRIPNTLNGEPHLQHFYSTWPGSYNLENLSLVAITLALCGFHWEPIAQAIRQIALPPGRLEKIHIADHSKVPDATTLSKLPNVYIDYAHTPHALAQVLQCLQHERIHHDQGKLWCIFGCGGNRDHDKRPEMGNIAKRYADRVIVTSDNPRDENPMAILQAIYPTHSKKIVFEIDRQKAIFDAIHSANAEDCILIAGKGHETYQEIAGQRLPFSDRYVATAALQKRLRSRS